MSDGYGDNEVIVYRIEVLEEEGRFVATWVTGDGREAGAGAYSASPIGALAELISTMIKVAEDTIEDTRNTAKQVEALFDRRPT